MRAAAVAAAVVAAFVGVMYLRFASDSVPAPPAGAGGPQCVVFRTASDGDDAEAQATCGPSFESPAAPVSAVRAGPSAQPKMAAPPDSIGGVKVESLTVGPEIEFPAQVAMIVLTGCECDIPPTGLTRVYRDPSGSLRVDELFRPENLVLDRYSIETANGQEHVTPWITSFAAAADGSQMFLGVCARGDCRNPQDGGAEHRLYRSTDGGVTWQDVGDLGPGTYLTDVVRDGEVLISTYRPSGSSSPTKPNELPPPPDYSFHPGGGSLAVPAGANAYWHPTVLNDREIGWLTQDGRILHSDGTPVLDLGRGARPYAFIYGADADRYGVLWSSFEPASDTYTGTILGIITPDGKLTRAYSSQDYLRIGAWLDYHILAGNSYRDAHPSEGYLPSLIDVSFGEVHQITKPFTDPPFQNGRNDVIAVQRGPFARVVNTDGTCVNVRAEPLPSAGILDCAAEGVLLRDTGEAGGPAGEWLKVVTPAGAQGWANAQYLER